MMTIEEFNKIPFGEIFQRGEIQNSSDGIEMFDYYKGCLMTWIAKKSDSDNSWAIYCYWTGVSNHFIKVNGHKVKDKSHIIKLVPCDQEMLSKYRF